MSEYGETFHERAYRSKELVSPESTDLRDFVSVWQRISEEGQLPADQALSELVDGLDVDEYTAVVHKLIQELELYAGAPFDLRGEGFFSFGAQGDVGLLPDGVFYRHMAKDRRTIHRIMATMGEDLDRDLHDLGLHMPVDCFEHDDYSYTKPTIRVLDAWHTDKQELDERSLEEKVHAIVEKSNIWIFEEDEMGKYSTFDMNGQAVADLIEHVGDSLPVDDRVIFAQRMNSFFEELTGTTDMNDYDVYRPFFDALTYGQAWEAEDADDLPNSIYQVIGTWDGMINRICQEVTDREDQLSDEGVRESLLNLFGLDDELADFYNGVDRETLLATRGHPKLPFPEQ